MITQAETKAHRIRIKGEAETVLCGTGEKALSAIERAFYAPTARPLRVGCRQGGCGACRIRVVSGRYSTGKMSRAHVSEAEQQQGYALACRVYPESDLEIEPAFLDPRTVRARKTGETTDW